jgi:hypothetical protein
MREAYVEKEAAKQMKQKQRERMAPKMGRMDIDYQVHIGEPACWQGRVGKRSTSHDCSSWPLTEARRSVHVCVDGKGRECMWQWI